MVYHGSELLSNLAPIVNIPLDKLNFLIAQLFALLLGIVLRFYLKPNENNTVKRHLFCLINGVFISFFCYGTQTLHLCYQAIVSYLILLYAPKKLVHLLLFVYAMGYLLCYSVYYILYDTNEHFMIVTTSLMINTQKITAMGFSYYDSLKSESELSKDQKDHVIRNAPSSLEFFSYMFSYQSLLAGPLCFYKDHIDFITGKNFTRYQKAKEHMEEPSNKYALAKKTVLVCLLAIIVMKVSVHYPSTRNIDKDVIRMPFIYRILFMWFTALNLRITFYFAWTLADLICNMSGLGFNGFDELNRPKWDLLTNVNITQIELATNVKMFFDAWNIQTQVWLKRICYDRLPKYKTLGVFTLSVVWHGFYPGYYFTFSFGAIFVYASRGIRRTVRPYFLKNKFAKIFYDILSWLCTITALSYGQIPVHITDIRSCIKFYSSYYWFYHILAILCAVGLPSSSKKSKRNKDSIPCEIEVNSLIAQSNLKNKDEHKKD